VTLHYKSGLKHLELEEKSLSIIYWSPRFINPFHMLINIMYNVCIQMPLLVLLSLENDSRAWHYVCAFEEFEGIMIAGNYPVTDNWWRKFSAWRRLLALNSRRGYIEAQRRTAIKRRCLRSWWRFIFCTLPRREIRGHKKWETTQITAWRLNNKVIQENL
jgi:hypothetical protein